METATTSSPARLLAMIRTQAMETYTDVSSKLQRMLLHFYLEVQILVEGMKVCERLSSGLGKLQFYFEIENFVEDMKICEILI
jgi:hypothetical protein